MEKFKMKTVMPASGSKCKVQIIQKHGELPEDNWGNKKYGFTALVNGEKLYWEASETALKGIQQVGSPNFWIQRWDKGGKTGFNYLMEDDAMLNVEPETTVAPKDTTQDKISRGAAWNNAFQYCLARSSTAPLNEFLKEVTKAAERIAPHQQAFVNGEAIQSPETPKPAEDDLGPIEDSIPPENEDYDYKSLPF